MRDIIGKIGHNPAILLYSHNTWLCFKANTIQIHGHNSSISLRNFTKYLSQNAFRQIYYSVYIHRSVVTQRLRRSLIGCCINREYQFSVTQPQYRDICLYTVTQRRSIFCTATSFQPHWNFLRLATVFI